MKRKKRIALPVSDGGEGGGQCVFTPILVLPRNWEGMIRGERKIKFLVADNPHDGKYKGSGYISELEHKVQTLQTTTQSAQITILQTDHAELTNQKIGLKCRLQAMEQQEQHRDGVGVVTDGWDTAAAPPMADPPVDTAPGIEPSGWD